MSATLGEIASIRTQLDRSGLCLVGESPAFVQLLEVLRKVARSDATVLLEGETGTGKELAARAIHYLSARRASPFIPVNCGAIPDTLIENELFGHRRGAYTDASAESPGLVRLAAGGTLFLDEVDALSLRAQVVLLRFLQDRRYRSLGARGEDTADIRVLAASNRNLQQEVNEGRMRPDLYYRLHLLTARLPPLRERPSDPALLARYFLHECSRHYRCPDKELEHETADWLDVYGWPGNVRELENLIHREFLLCEADRLRIPAPAGTAAKVTPITVTVPISASDVLPAYRVAKARALTEFNRAYLTQLLEQTEGNVTRAAQLAKKERRAFGRLLKRYNIACVNRDISDPL